MSNPFMGLKPYEKKDKDCYKGRDEDIRKFVRILDDGDFSVIYSESGIGKSSFLNAGITPVLESNGRVPVNVSFDFVQAPGQSKECKDFIIKSITGAIKRSLSEYHQSWRFIYSEQVPETDRYKFNDSLWSVLRTFTVCDGEEQKMMVLIFDQFEEIFTKASDVFRKSFFQTIEELGSDIPPKELIEELDRLNDAGIPLQLDVQQEYKVIFSLRKEYLAEFDYWTNDVYHLPQLLRNRMTLLPLSVEQAREVITDQKVDGNRLTLFDDVYDDIIKFITKGGRRNHLNGYDEQIVEPLLLSMLCYNLYEKYSGNHKIPASSKWGFDLNNYVWDFYDSTISKIVRKKSHRAIIEKALVDEYGHRNRTKTSSGPLHNIGFTESYQKKLDDSHIIRTDDEYIELIHDRLADVIFKKRKQQFLISGRKTRPILLCLATLVLISVTFRMNYSTENPSRLSSQGLTELVPKNGVYYIDGIDKISHDYERVYVKNVEHGVVSGMPNLSELIIANSCGDVVISECPNLSSLIPNENLESLHISKCPNIRYLNIPNSLRKLSFTDTIPQSIEFMVPDSHKYYRWSDGILWDLDTESIEYARADADSIVSFPKDTPLAQKESIKWRTKTFYNQAYIDTVHIVNDTILLKVYKKRNVSVIDLSQYYSVTELGDSLLMGYDSVARVILPKNVKKIGNSTFRDCKFLEVVENMDNVTSIGEYAFAGCKSFKQIKIPPFLSKLGHCAFMDCINLKSVTLPHSDTCFSYAYSRGYSAFSEFSPFYRCYSIDTIENLDTSHFIFDNKILFTKNHAPIFTVAKSHSYNGFFSYNVDKDSVYSENGLLYIKGIMSGHRYPLSIPEAQLNNKDLCNFHYMGTHLYSSYLGRHSLVIINTGNNLEIYVPASGHYCTSMYSPDNISIIHVCWPDPTGTYNHMIKTIPESYRKNIVLYVPYGTKYRYLANNEYFSFKDVKEDSLAMRLFSMFYCNIVLNGITLILAQKRLSLLFLVSMLFWFFFSWIHKQDTNKKRFAIVLLPLMVCFYISIYWFAFIGFYSPHLDISTAVILSNVTAFVPSILAYRFLTHIEYEHTRDAKVKIRQYPNIIKNYNQKFYSYSNRVLTIIHNKFNKIVATVISHKKRSFLFTFLFILLFLFVIYCVQVMPGFIYEFIAESRQTDITSKTSGSIPHQRIPIYGDINSISFSPDSKKIAVASGDNCWVVDIKTGQSDRVLRLNSEISQVVYHEEDDIFVFYGGDSTLHWKPSVNKKFKQEHSPGYSWDKSKCYSNSTTQYIYFDYHNENCHIIGYNDDDISIHLPYSSYFDIQSFCAGGDNLVIYDHDDNLSIYDIHSADTIANRHLDDHRLHGLCIDKNGKCCFLCKSEVGYLYFIYEDKLEKVQLPDNIYCTCSDISSDYIAIAETDKIHIIDRSDNKFIKTLSGVHLEKIHSIQTSDSPYILSVSGSQYTVWDALSGDTIKSYEKNTYDRIALVDSCIFKFEYKSRSHYSLQDSILVLSINNLDTTYFGEYENKYYFHNHNFLVTSSYGSLRIYHPTSNCTRTVKEPYGRYKDYGLANNGLYDFWLSYDDTLYIRNTDINKIIHRLKVPSDIHPIQLLNNRQMLMHNDSSLFIYDYLKNNWSGSKTKHKNYSGEVFISNDQKYIITRYGPFVYVYDAKDLNFINDFKIADGNSEISISHDDKYVYQTGGTSIKAWKIPYDKLKSSDSD